MAASRERNGGFIDKFDSSPLLRAYSAAVPSQPHRFHHFALHSIADMSSSHFPVPVADLTTPDADDAPTVSATTTALPGPVSYASPPRFSCIDQSNRALQAPAAVAPAPYTSADEAAAIATCQRLALVGNIVSMSPTQLTELLSTMDAYIHSAAVQTAGLRAFYHTAQSPRNRVTMGQVDGGLARIYAAMDRHQDDEEVQNWGCVALAAMLPEASVKASMEATDAVSRAVRAQQRFPGPTEPPSNTVAWNSHMFIRRMAGECTIM